jgi:crotonobetainyl-CoA:carnitine CoA-transferase CaiB-like acyl-CoA transferase
MLEGLKVVELASHVAAPAAAGMLAEWGADVVKIEPAEGDIFREGYEHLTPDGESPAFQLDNRGKRSVVLDVRTPDGREALMRLIRGADVFITNRRPRALKALGVDYESLRVENPRLIYASVTGYGLQGPDIDLPGYDVAAWWSRAGVASMLLPKGDEPFILRTGIGDHTCSLATVSGIMAAAFERNRTGAGRLVETSLIRSGVYSIGADVAVQRRLGRIGSTRPRSAAIAPLVNFYRSAEGQWICLMPRNARADWPRIAAAAGRPELADDPRFKTDRGRRENTAELVGILDAAFGAIGYDELARRFTEADLVWAPVQTIAQVTQDPQAIAAGCFVDIPDGQGGTIPSAAVPVRFPGADDGPKGPSPRIGEHTDAVLTEAGYSAAEIAAMRVSGATV